MKSNTKQLETLFSTSIQVLNCLVGEYQQKFNVQIEIINKEQDCRNVSFDGFRQFQIFYERLKNLFESLYFKCQSQGNQKNLLSESESQRYFEIKMNKQSDDDLYQLVMQLKDENYKKIQKIKQLTKQIKEKSFNIKQFSKKSFQQQNQLKITNAKCKQLCQEVIKLEKENSQFQQKFLQLQKKYEQLHQVNQKICQDIINKSQKILELQKSFSILKDIKQSKEKIEKELSEIQYVLGVQRTEKKIQEEDLIKSRSSLKKLKSQNYKLVKIIEDKLSFIKDQSSGKQNVSRLNQHISQLIEQKLTDKELLGNTIQKQIGLFIQNIALKCKKN